MLRFPRIEVIKRTIYVPIYRESYEVQTMRPNPTDAKQIWHEQDTSQCLFKAYVGSSEKGRI